MCEWVGVCVCVCVCGDGTTKGEKCARLKKVSRNHLQKNRNGISYMNLDVTFAVFLCSTTVI